MQTAFDAAAAQLAIRYGQTGIPRLERPELRRSGRLRHAAPPGQPKPRFSLPLPERRAALISVRLRPDLSEDERREAIELIRDAVADPAFRDPRRRATSSAACRWWSRAWPRSSRAEIFVLLVAAAIVIMAVVLLLIFGPPLRLLPLAIALGAAALVFGLLARASAAR